MSDTRPTIDATEPSRQADCGATEEYPTLAYEPTADPPPSRRHGRLRTRRGRRRVGPRTTGGIRLAIPIAALLAVAARRGRLLGRRGGREAPRRRLGGSGLAGLASRSAPEAARNRGGTTGATGATAASAVRRLRRHRGGDRHDLGRRRQHAVRPHLDRLLVKVTLTRRRRSRATPMRRAIDLRPGDTSSSRAGQPRTVTSADSSGDRAGGQLDLDWRVRRTRGRRAATSTTARVAAEISKRAIYGRSATLTRSSQRWRSRVYLGAGAFAAPPASDRR